MMTAGRHAVQRMAFRLVAAGVTLVIVAIATFLSLNVLKGGFANVYLGPRATQEQIDALNTSYGLDRPVHEQLMVWLGGIVRGDFGTSLVSGQPVSEIIALRLPVTAELAIYATVLAILIGVPAGIFVGLRSRGRASAGVRLISVLSISLPDFVVASLIVFVMTRISPETLQLGTYTPLTQDPGRNLTQMFFPALTLSLYPAAVLMRTLRDSVQGVLTEPYVKAAVLRGESRRELVRRNVFRNSLLPAITVATVGFGSLFGGAVIVETVFALPGMGQQLVSAINQRDFAVVQASVVIGAAAFIAVNLLSDWINTLVDPRLRK